MKISFLSKNEVEKIHDASLAVLERTGIMVKNQKALELLEKYNCEVESQLVKIPSELVERTIKSTESSITLYSRDKNQEIKVGDDNVIYNPGSSAIYVIDRDTGELRRANTLDLVQLVRLVDALEHIKAQSTAIVPSDVPDSISDLFRLYVILKNSAKPIITGAFTKEGLIDMKIMLESVMGDSQQASAPTAIFDCCPSSPLMWSDTTCQNLIDCSRFGIPAEIIPAPQMGATSPVTLAGTIVQSNAEFLSGVVISQLVKPGAPLIYGGSPAAFDMRFCTMRLGAIEAIMVACSMAEMGKHYGVPTHAYLGLSDSKAVDGQSGFESSLGIFFAALAGVNIVSGPGMLACENCQSLEKLVIDNELCGTAYRLLEGYSVDEPTLAVDLINKVGPGGHFLAEKHTRVHLRNERFIPSDLVDRLSPDSWKKKGKKVTIERAKEIVDKTLSEHEHTPLPKEADKRLDKVLREILKRKEISMSQLPLVV